jgi:two-component system chemotaxis response regulator CheB
VNGISGRDIVVVAASAGGVEALRSLLAALPADLRAAVLVVLHISPGAGSALPDILDRAGPLKAAAAADGEPLEHGRVYVAPPDMHLLIDGRAVRLSRGPRHNGHRPAADPLFLSAAAFAGPRTFAVVLSGSLDDGARGCAMVEQRGGAVAVQDPKESAFTGMPLAARAATANCRVGPVRDIARWIVAETTAPVEAEDGVADERLHREVSAFLSASLPPTPDGQLSTLSCPDCNGPLYEVATPPERRYQCIVGHAWSMESMIDGQAAAVERAYWIAILRLEERLRLVDRMIDNAEQRGQTITARRLRRQADQDREALQTLRALQAAVAASGDGPDELFPEPHIREIERG